ncbi:MULTISPECIES: hypothetical protein [unclassified Helicobacter]|uniref:hypothetical protein n=1 Tax=unclassified Helicobacter TaxID=2593540 RepID=UPI000CF15320|nr:MULTISPECIES: hypothetical protein [unclassified Helicobacter]
MEIMILLFSVALLILFLFIKVIIEHPLLGLCGVILTALFCLVGFWWGALIILGVFCLVLHKLKQDF